jgi:hypothetical protein
MYSANYLRLAASEYRMAALLLDALDGLLSNILL